MRTKPSPAREIRISIHTGPSRHPADHARRGIAAVIRAAPEPVLFAVVRLSTPGDPAARCPIVARANLDLNGTTVRESVTAPTACEAIDLLAAKLGSVLSA